MVETKLNVENNQHKLLIALMAEFVESYGYKPRELYELMRDAENKLFHALVEIYNERPAECNR